MGQEQSSYVKIMNNNRDKKAYFSVLKSEVSVNVVISRGIAYASILIKKKLWFSFTSKHCITNYTGKHIEFRARRMHKLISKVKLITFTRMIPGKVHTNTMILCPDHNTGTRHTTDTHRCTLATPWHQSVAYHLAGDYALPTQQTTWC